MQLCIRAKEYFTTSQAKRTTSEPCRNARMVSISSLVGTQVTVNTHLAGPLLFAGCFTNGNGVCTSLYWFVITSTDDSYKIIRDEDHHSVCINKAHVAPYYQQGTTVVYTAYNGRMSLCTVIESIISQW